MTQEVHLGPVIEKLRKGVCRRLTTGRPAVVVDIEETERFMASVADILSLVVRASSTPDISPALRATLQQRHDLLREDARTDAANNYRYTTLEEHDASVAEADEIERLLRARSSAPEAREEALGNLLAVIHGDGGHRALEVGTKQAALEAEKIVAGLFAAPSADKLRISVEALSWSEKALERYVDALGLDQTDDAALHALYLCGDALTALSTPDALKGDTKP